MRILKREFYNAINHPQKTPLELYVRGEFLSAQLKNINSLKVYGRADGSKDYIQLSFISAFNYDMVDTASDGLYSIDISNIDYVKFIFIEAENSFELNLKEVES